MLRTENHHASRAIVSTVLAAAILAAPAAAAESFVDGWEDGTTSCWVGNTIDTELVVETEQGNPGGWIRSYPTDGPGQAGLSTTKPEVLGNWITSGVSGLAVDARGVISVPTVAGFRVRESGVSNGWYYAVDVEQITETWSTVEAPIDPTWNDEEAIAAGWVKIGENDPGWEATLASHFQLSFRAFSGVPGFEMGYDNFRVTFDGPSCTADINQDATVDVEDLIILLAGWDVCNCCPHDVNRDRMINFGDLVPLLGQWGPCPTK